MLQFTDLNHTKHVVNLNNMQTVVFRNTNGTYQVTFHMIGQHFLTATVDMVTFETLQKKLGAAA